MSLPPLLSGLRRRVRNFRFRAAARRHLDRGRLEKLHEENRRLVTAVPEWISDETLRTSIFRYGIPEEIRDLIDRDVGFGASYTDALALFAASLRKPVSYLEIGISVGKNFW